jgi:hypothetical protein
MLDVCTEPTRRPPTARHERRDRSRENPPSKDGGDHPRRNDVERRSGSHRATIDSCGGFSFPWMATCSGASTVDKGGGDVTESFAHRDAGHISAAGPHETQTETRALVSHVAGRLQSFGCRIDRGGLITSSTRLANARLVSTAAAAAATCSRLGYCPRCRRQRRRQSV